MLGVFTKEQNKNEVDTLKTALHLAHIVRSGKSSAETSDKHAHVGAIGAKEKRKGGQGHQFWQFRDYTQGDAPKSIDWRRTARGDAVIVKDRADEQADTLRLWVDPNLKTSQKKKQCAEIIALTLAHLVHEDEDKTALLSRDKSRGARGMKTLQGHAHSLRKNICVPVKDLKKLKISKYDFFVLISDFWSPFSDFKKQVLPFLKTHPKGILIQTASREENEFPFVGRTRFSAQNNNNNQLTIEDAQAVRDAYLSAIKAHKEKIAEDAHKYNWSFMSLTASEDLVPALHKIYTTLMTGGER